MAKNVIREIIIILLLCLAIILILGVLLYEYVPSNKMLPEKLSYVTPQNVKEELQSSDGVNEDGIILTYELEQSDLNNYQRIKNYKPGKTNPFSSYETQTQTQNQSGGNTTTNNGTAGNTSVNNSQTTNNNSQETTSGNANQTTQSSGTNSNTTGYFQDKGTK